MINNETPQYCEGCGKCCKKTAGWYGPADVIADLTAMSQGDISLLGSKYQIDCLDGLPSIYILRPAHKPTLGQKVDFSWGGECVNLGEKGCSLSFEERPTQCKTLEAYDYHKCKQFMSKYDIANLWLPFQHIFEKVFKLI